MIERQGGGGREKGGEKFQLASWNFGSLLNSSGPVETAFAGAENKSLKNKNVDDRCIDVVVAKLKGLKIEVAGLQETTWSVKEVYTVGDSAVLASGRSLPTSGDFRRGEGVAIVLRGRTLAAWKARGLQWTAMSPRLVIARLQLTDPHGRPILYHVIACYAPTFRALKTTEEQFYDKLQTALLSVTGLDKFVVLGDFNARVGSHAMCRE